MYIDTHAHLDDDRFADDLQQVVEGAQDADVRRIVTIGTDPDSCRRAIELAEQYDCVYAAVGLHPHDAKTFTGDLLQQVRRMCEHQKVVAVGEVGLDFHYCNSPRATQKRVFAIFADLAADLQMPLIVHTREAGEETLEVLDDSGQPDQTVIIHCFTGDEAYAEECLDRGFFIGLGGIVTFPNAEALRAAVKSIPADRILLETDCPYLAPQSRRGERNEPAYIPFIAKEIAQLKGIREGELRRLTTATARKVYGI